MPACAVAALGGNVVVQRLPELPPGPVLVSVLALGLAAVCLPSWRWLGFAAIAFAYTASLAAERLEQRWPAGAGAQDVALKGWIDGFLVADDTRAAFSFRVEEASAPNVPRRLRLSWYDAPEGIRAGASLEIVARLRAPRGLKNPGLFDYERWLFTEGYGASGYVRTGSVDDAADAGIAQTWLRFRAALAERIDARMPNPDAAALTRALTLGERSRFSDAQWTLLRRTGTTHLVAISGLHVGLVAAMSFWVLLRIGLRLPYVAARHAWVAAACLTALVATFYAALAGFSTPTQRALVMLFVALSSLVWKRRPGHWHCLSVALVLVVVYDPFATLSVSFWLSFGAVAILLLLGGCRSIRGEAAPSSSIRAFARLQWCVTLGLAPLIVGYFGELSIAAPIVNLVAIPWFSFVLVPLTLIAAACAYVGVDGMGVVTLAADLAAATWDALAAISAAPWAAFELPQVGAAVAAVAVIAAWIALPSNAFPARRAAWFATLPLFTVGAGRPEAGAAEVTIIDVGQGLAVLVETRDHRLLYDAGPVYRSGFDTGREIVGPLLRASGSRPLDMLIVSHDDNDHSGGARAVLQSHPEARVLLGPDVRGISGDICVRNQAWVWDDVAFAIVHPAADFAPRGNDSSCVLRVSTARHSLLLTGDIEARAERELASKEDLRSDFVLVPHHGSSTSSTPEFVAATSARYAFVSAGHGNRWGFPRQLVRDRWAARGADLLVTGDVGAIRLTMGTGASEPRVERRVARRYWEPETGAIPGESSTGAL